jgi:hypothetical protein
MRELKIFEHISLDGVIEVRGSGEAGDPLGQFNADIDAARTRPGG